MSNLSVEERDRYWWLLFAIDAIGKHCTNLTPELRMTYERRWHRNRTEMRQDLKAMAKLLWIGVHETKVVGWEMNAYGKNSPMIRMSLNIRSDGYIQMNECRLCATPGIAEEFLRGI